jgi:hypothetical protein
MQSANMIFLHTGIQLMLWAIIERMKQAAMYSLRVLKDVLRDTKLDILLYNITRLLHTILNITAFYFYRIALVFEIAAMITYFAFGIPYLMQVSAINFLAWGLHFLAVGAAVAFPLAAVIAISMYIFAITRQHSYLNTDPAMRTISSYIKTGLPIINTIIGIGVFAVAIFTLSFFLTGFVLGIAIGSAAISVGVLFNTIKNIQLKSNHSHLGILHARWDERLVDLMHGHLFPGRQNLWVDGEYNIALARMGAEDAEANAHNPELEGLYQHNLRFLKEKFTDINIDAQYTSIIRTLDRLSQEGKSLIVKPSSEITISNVEAWRLAKQGVNDLFSVRYDKNKYLQTGITGKEILALVWTAAHDESLIEGHGDLNLTEVIKMRELAFFERLADAQWPTTIDGHPFCFEGHVTRLLKSLEGGVKGIKPMVRAADTIPLDAKKYALQLAQTLWNEERDDAKKLLCSWNNEDEDLLLAGLKSIVKTKLEKDYRDHYQKSTAIKRDILETIDVWVENLARPILHIELRKVVEDLQDDASVCKIDEQTIALNKITRWCENELERNDFNGATTLIALNEKLAAFQPFNGQATRIYKILSKHNDSIHYDDIFRLIKNAFKNYSVVNNNAFDCKKNLDIDLHNYIQSHANNESSNSRATLLISQQDDLLIAIQNVIGERNYTQNTTIVDNTTSDLTNNRQSNPLAFKHVI